MSLRHWTGTVAERLTVKQFNNYVEIRYRWFEATVVTTAIIPIALIAFPMGLAQAAKGTRGSGWSVFAIFVVIWAICTYCYLAKLLNTTVIKIDDVSLSVSHSPIPWIPGPTLRRTEIEALFAREKFHSQFEGGTEIGGYTGEVIARVSGMEVKVVRRLSNLNYAYAIADHIRQAIGIGSTDD